MIAGVEKLIEEPLAAAVTTAEAAALFAKVCFATRLPAHLSKKATRFAPYYMRDRRVNCGAKNPSGACPDRARRLRYHV